MMKAKKDIYIICVCLLLYITNQVTKTVYYGPAFPVFLKNYYNDILCGCLIIAISNYILSYYKYGSLRINSLLIIVLFNLCCGLFWEFVIPIIRRNRTSDYVDIIAYLIGGFVYWIIWNMIQKID